MTEQTNTETLATPAEVFASLRAARQGHAATTSRVTDVYDGLSVRVSQAGAVLEDGDSEALARQRADNGASLSGAMNDVSAITGRVNFLQAKLADGAHDPRTGEWRGTLQPHLKAAFEVELSGLREELTTALRTVEEVKARQAHEQAAERVRVENDAAVHEFTNGDPARKAALDKALLAKESEFMAEYLLKRQYGLG